MTRKTTSPSDRPGPVPAAPMLDLVPLSLFELDHPRPHGGWGAFLTVRGIEVVRDHVGRDAIRAEDAAGLLGEHREAEQVKADERRRRLAALPKRPKPRGIPAIEGMDAHAVQLAADAHRRKPSVHQQLLDEALAQGRKAGA